MLLFSRRFLYLDVCAVGCLQTVELREAAREIQDQLERAGVKIPPSPDDQEEAVVNAATQTPVQAAGGKFCRHTGE